MRSCARPLDNSPLIRTRDVAEMCGALERVYAKPTWHIESGAKAVDVTLNYRQLNHIGLGYTKYGINLDLVYPESDFTLQTFPLRGQGEANVGQLENALDSRHGATVSPGRGFAVKLAANYEHLLLVINSKTLIETATAITGQPIIGPIEFDPAPDYRRPAARALRDHAMFIVNTVSTAAASLPKILTAEFDQTLAVLVLHANRHNYSHLLERAERDAAPWQVRCAEDYIEANWRQPITLDCVVAATGVSALDLYRTFKKSRGYSPMEFATRVRLRQARELLLRHPAPTTTVAEVAAICGFADLGDFDRNYSVAFGERPGQTLGRSVGPSPEV